MKELLILRHAKSSWDSGARRDFDRPLNARGRNAAPLMGRFIAGKNLVPDIVFCSAAVRTRETFDLLKTAFEKPPAVIYRENLYLASVERLLETIADADDADERVMVIGHNPGMEDLALTLADPRASDQRALLRLSEKYPTGALTEFAFDIPAWREIAPETGKMKRFVAPKDLNGNTS